MLIILVFPTWHFRNTGQKRRRNETEDQQEGANAEPAQASATSLQVKPAAIARGHTGYLTFARRIVTADAPISESPEVAQQNEEALE